MTDSTTPLQFSIIIPAFNEARHIENCLQALVAQTFGKKDFEVIVVDNGSLDETVAKASIFLPSLPLQIVSRPKARISAVRNYGASLARGETLAFLDADCMAPPDWLVQAQVLRRPNTIWGAHYLIPSNSTWVGRIWFDYQAKARQGAVSFIPAGDLFIAKSEFTRIGGFSEALQTSEDVELCLRARSFGLEVLAFPSMGVVHEGTARTLGHFYRQNRWHGSHVLRMFLHNLPSTRNLPIVALSLYTLVFFWAALLAPLIFLPLHHPLLAMFPLLLLLLPAITLSGVKSSKSRRVKDGPALFVLYLTYLLARAASLLHIAERGKR